MEESPHLCKPSTVPQVFRQMEFVGLGDHQGHVPAETPLAGFDALIQKVLVGSPSRNSLNVADHPDHWAFIDGLWSTTTLCQERKQCLSCRGRDSLMYHVLHTLPASLPNPSHHPHRILSAPPATLSSLHFLTRNLLCHLSGPLHLPQSLLDLHLFLETVLRANWWVGHPSSASYSTWTSLP